MSDEHISAIDADKMRQANNARRVIDELRRTIRLVPVSGAGENYSNVRVEFTDKSLEVLAPFIGAWDVMQAIIFASDGCVGHRQCAHSMEPWQRARKLLYDEDAKRYPWLSE